MTSVGRTEPNQNGIAVDAIATLSVREEEVLRLASAGLLDKEIGRSLGISLNTLRTYWTRIRGKVGEGSRSALAIAYVAHKTSKEDDGPDWEADLVTGKYEWISDRENPVGATFGSELSIEGILSMIHPEDAHRVRKVLDDLYSNDTSAFFLQARFIEGVGPIDISAFIRVVRDEKGKPTGLVGRRTPIHAFRKPAVHSISIGHWQRDLRTNIFTADEGFRSIFGIEADVSDVRAAAYERFHPDELSHARSFVTDAVATRKTHSRSTHRLKDRDGSFKWVTTDLLIDYDGDEAILARGTVIGFD